MLEIIRDEKGNIQAVLEWNLLNKQGQMDKEGKYIWINKCEVNPDARSNGIIKKFIRIVTDKVPWFEMGYYKRGKRNSKIRMFSRERWLKQLGGSDV